MSPILKPCGTEAFKEDKQTNKLIELINSYKK